MRRATERRRRRRRRRKQMWELTRGGRNGEERRLNIHYQATGEKSKVLLLLCVGSLPTLTSRIASTSTPNEAEAVYCWTYWMRPSSDPFQSSCISSTTSDTSHLIRQHEPELWASLAQMKRGIIPILDGSAPRELGPLPVFGADSGSSVSFMSWGVWVERRRSLCPVTDL